jgi:hypothetical protein
MSMAKRPGKAKSQAPSRRLPPKVVSAIADSSVIGIKAGARTDHRFIGVWPIVVKGRVFVRSWTLKPDGWYHTFLSDPLGTIQIGDRNVRVRAVPIGAKRLCGAIERAYAEKYSTPASMKYVRGFKTARRRGTTMEFIPR